MSGKGPSPNRRFPEVGRQTQRRDSCLGAHRPWEPPTPPQPGHAADPVLLEGWGRARWGSRRRREGPLAGRVAKAEAAGRQVLAGRRPGQGTSGEGCAPWALDGCRSDHPSLINEAVQRGLLMRTRGLSQPGGSCWNSKGTAGKLSPLLRHSRSEGSGPSPGREGAGRPVPQGGCAQLGSVNRQGSRRPTPPGDRSPSSSAAGPGQAGKVRQAGQGPRRAGWKREVPWSGALRLHMELGFANQ